MRQGYMEAFCDGKFDGDLDIFNDNDVRNDERLVRTRSASRWRPKSSSPLGRVRCVCYLYARLDRPPPRSLV